MMLIVGVMTFLSKIFYRQCLAPFDPRYFSWFVDIDGILVDKILTMISSTSVSFLSGLPIISLPV